MLPANNPRNLLRRIDRARRFPENTCPASRHVELVARAMINGDDRHLLDEDDFIHVGYSMLSVVESLYKARTKLAKGK